MTLQEKVMNDKDKSILSRILLIADIAALVAVSLFTVSAVKIMGEKCHELREADISKDHSGIIYYDDHLYAMLGFGIEIDARETGNEERMDEFITSSLRSIDERVYGTFAIYTMVIAAALALFLYETFRNKHILSIVLSTMLIYLLLFGVFALSSLIHEIPVYLPRGEACIGLIVSILSVVGGCCALGLLIRKIRFKKITALLAIPLVIALFIFGTIFEAQLYCPKQIESFDYITSSISEDYEGEYLYDDNRNVIIVDGKEYGPQLVDNPNYLKGAGRIGAFAFELADPYSGNGLELVRQFNLEDGNIASGQGLPYWVYLIYGIKALCWIALSSMIKEKA